MLEGRERGVRGRCLFPIFVKVHSIIVIYIRYRGMLILHPDSKRCCECLGTCSLSIDMGLVDKDGMQAEEQVVF